MNPQTIALLKRVKDIVNDNREWFEAVYAWYKNAKLTRRLIEELCSNDEADLLALHVNANQVTTLAQVDDRRIRWTIPVSVLQRGDNDITITLDERSQTALHVNAASARQVERMPTQLIDLSSEHPKPAQFLAFLRSSEACHQDDCWAVFPKGFMKLRVQLERVAPVELELQLPEGRSFPQSKLRGDRRRELLDGIADKVKDAVKKKLKDLEESLPEARKRRDGKVERIESERNDLRAYDKLHRDQLTKAVRGLASITLEQVIRDTAPPDTLIQPFVQEPAPVPVVHPVVEQVPTKAKAPSRKKASKPGGWSNLLARLLFLAAIVSTGAVIYNNVPSEAFRVDTWFAPTVKIVSLENDQRIPAGREFQVAVTSETSIAGSLDNAELRVTAAGEVDAVQAEPRRFAAGVVNPPSQIFTFRTRENRGVEETITITAQLFRDGKPSGKPDVVKAKSGGNQTDLFFSISPATLAPGIDAQVTITVLNAPANAMVAFTVRGDPDPDQFQGKGTLPVDAVGVLLKGDELVKEVLQTGSVTWRAGDEKLPPAGNDRSIRFTVPAGRFPGVVDTIEATLQGTNITRKARYSF